MFGTSIPIVPSELTAPAGSNNPGLFFLNQLLGRGEPEFIYENRRTTILLSPALLGQIETAADSRAPELGYSVFHCGQGVLQVYRAVALEVDFANSDPESMRATWTNCRCAISSDLGQDGVRLLYSIGDMSLCRDMIALEAEDNEDESNEDEE
ncbi:hypothetical protein N7444_002402 [Penicillium canescens]|nr:hypothetical protein N7444_002402 [Penicillium canescens]